MLSNIIYTKNMVRRSFFTVEQESMHANGNLGPVVRLAPNLIVFDDPRLLPKLYHRNADKSDFYHTSILGDTRPAFQIIGAKDHLVRRKILAPSVRRSPEIVWRKANRSSFPQGPS